MRDLANPTHMKAYAEDSDKIAKFQNINTLKILIKHFKRKEN